MTRLGIIADDFTGATDVAGLAVRQGATASVVTGAHRSLGDDDDAVVETNNSGDIICNSVHNTEFLFVVIGITALFDVGTGGLGSGALPILCLLCPRRRVNRLVVVVSKNETLSAMKSDLRTKLVDLPS